MTFTEVAFELADPKHPLCRLTRPPQKSHAVYRVLDHGEASGRHRAHVSFHGPPSDGADLEGAMQATEPHGSVEPLYRSDGHTSFSLETDPRAGGLGVTVSILQQHSLPAILDPMVAIDGKLRVRLVIARRAEAQQVLRALQDVQRATGFADFRILRIAPLSPAAHVELSRRALPPEHETLLALAASMGYYDTPKSVTLEQIARAVGLSISPVHKRLKAAEESIVSQYIARGDGARQRRRARRPPLIEPTSPWELQLRVRDGFGPSALLAQTPEARAALHVLSADGARAQSSLLVVVAPQEAQAKVLAGLEDRPEIASFTLVDRAPSHVVCRLTTRDRGAYAVGWFGEAWGSDAALRSVVFERGEAHVRALLTRPTTAEKLDERVRECAQAAGWSHYEVEALRDLADGSTPPTWPEPLTQRQLEVLQLAHTLGYYRTPRGCTLEHVATTLGVSANAVHKNLVLAESKLIGSYLAAGL